MEYIACISNNNRNPCIDRSGLNFLLSPDLSSSSSGKFPENEPHSYEAPTEVVEFVQLASEEIPTQPPTQVANEVVVEPMSLQKPSPLRQLCTSFAHPTFILLTSGPGPNFSTLRDRFFSEQPQSAQSAEEMGESSRDHSASPSISKRVKAIDTGRSGNTAFGGRFHGNSPHG